MLLNALHGLRMLALVKKQRLKDDQPKTRRTIRPLFDDGVILVPGFARTDAKDTFLELNMAIENPL